mmetsp:Transcript_45562/g.89649  ORF Transcript_45562/g.89649 Transcript_45562/m.89649 type:complete len:889 (+) Transcript_45562:41-2707(+)
MFQPPSFLKKVGRKGETDKKRNTPSSTSRIPPRLQAGANNIVNKLRNAPASARSAVNRVVKIHPPTKTTTFVGESASTNDTNIKKLTASRTGVNNAPLSIGGRGAAVVDTKPTNFKSGSLKIKSLRPSTKNDSSTVQPPPLHQLDTIPLFQELTSEEKCALSALLEEKSFKSGAVLTQEGEISHGLFIIRQGEASVAKRDPKTRIKYVVQILKQGSHFGEAAGLNNPARGYMVTAKTPLLTWYLDKDKFSKLFSIVPDALTGAAGKRKAVKTAHRPHSRRQSLDPSSQQQAQLDRESTRKKDSATTAFLLQSLQANVMFALLEPHQQADVVARMYEKPVAAGELLTARHQEQKQEQEQEQEGVFVVFEGEFSVFTAAQPGASESVEKKSTFVATLGRGAVIGIDQLLLSSTYSQLDNQTVKATKRGTVWAISGNDYLATARPAATTSTAPTAKASPTPPTFATTTNNKPTPTTTTPTQTPTDAWVLVGAVSPAASNTTDDLPCCSYPSSPVSSPADAADQGHQQQHQVREGSVEGQEGKQGEAVFDEDGWRQGRGEKAIPRSSLERMAFLGKGSYGHVELMAEKRSDGKEPRIFALKACMKQELVECGQLNHIVAEKRCMQLFDCPFLLNLHATYQDEHCVYFLLEAALGGELFNVLRAQSILGQSQACFYIAATVVGLEYLHSLDYIYRDLKPENVLLMPDGYPKIADFGFAKRLTAGDDYTTHTLCGTPDYLAPEVILGSGHSFGFDWWCVGILIYELLAGQPPFCNNENDTMKTYEDIVLGNLRYPSHFSQSSRLIITEFLQNKAEDRLGLKAGGVANIYQHEWFRGFDFAALKRKELQPPHIPQVQSQTDTSNFDGAGDDEYLTPMKYISKPELDTMWDREFGS